MEFDFSKLNAREFEALGSSIIEKIIGERVEVFKPGKDGGVDGRFWFGKNKEVIIQCKHYLETPYKTLISKLKTEEFAKVKKLNPSKYIFITSKKLSRLNKKTIKEIFHPFIHREDDIFGLDDLNIFLSKRENQDIVEQNFKLWITSSSVLDLIYNNAIKGRSESTLSEIEKKAYKYAITENHKKGLQILEIKNVLILTGEPGIGKTTLADSLTLHYMGKGYEFCDIEENISEAESIYREKEKKKILFYCDDFLGSNLYDAISNKKDSHIVRFITRVSKDNSKKFILTSRTTILNKAYSLSHAFQNGKIRDNEFLLKVKNLTSVDKALILYNHVYHSNLEIEYIDKIYEDKKYREIINHRNFNPRIIEFVTDNIRVGNILPDNYWNYIKKNLDEPKSIWENYFQHQTDDSIRALVFLTVFNNGKISEEILGNAYYTYLRIHNVNLGDQSDKSFTAVSKLTAKSLLNRIQLDENMFEYVLFNPSIADFIISSYSDDSELISDVLKSLKNQNSLNFIKALVTNSKIKRSCIKRIQENLFDYFFEMEIQNENWDFLILLISLDISNKKLKTRIKQFLNTLITSNEQEGSNLSELLMILTEFEPEIVFENLEFLYGFTEDLWDEETLKDLMNFVEKYEINDSFILSKIEVYLTNYIENMIKNDDLDIDFGDHINHFHYPDGTPEIEINSSSIKYEIHQQIDSFLGDFNESVLAKLNLKTSHLVSDSDIDRMTTSYLEKLDYGQYHEDENRDNFRASYSSDDGIDAIFER